MKRAIALALLLVAGGVSPSVAAPRSPAIQPAPLNVLGSETKGLDIYQVLDMFARGAGLNVNIYSSVPHEPVTYRIVGMNDQAILAAILRAHDLGGYAHGGILDIAPLSIIATRYGMANGVFQSIPVTGNPDSLVDQLRKVTSPDLVLISDALHHTIIANGPPDSIARLRDMLGVSTNTAPVPLKTHTFSLHGGNQLDAVMAALNTLEVIAPPNALVPSPTGDAIIARGTPEFINATEADLTVVDVQPRQILYSASIIEIVPNTYTRSQGIEIGGIQIGQGSNESSGFSVGSSNAIQVNMNLQAMEARGEAHILKRATILTATAKPGTTFFGTDVPVQVNSAVAGVGSVGTLQTVSEGVSLGVIPYPGDHLLRTVLQSKYTEQLGIGVSGAPILARRNFESEVLSTYDQAILIGGYYSDSKQMTMTKAPPFSNIPILGALFRHKDVSEDHTEVIVVLEPHIYDPNNPNLNILFPAVDRKYFDHGVAPAPLSSATPTPVGAHHP